MTDDTARRERALTFVQKDDWEESEWVDIIDYQDNVDMDTPSSERFACYLAGAREEAAIKDAEIAALREFVRWHFMHHPQSWPGNAEIMPAVRRALEGQP